MYTWIWGHLPGPVAVKLVQTLDVPGPSPLCAALKTFLASPRL